MIFTQCIVWHRNKNVGMYIHTYVGFQTRMCQAGLYLSVSHTVIVSINIAGECVL